MKSRTQITSTSSVLILLLALVLIASPFAMSKTVLTVMDWKLNETAETQAWFQWVKEEFERRNPDVEIEYVTVPWGDQYKERFVVTSAANTPPDVISLSIIWARDFWDQGLLLNLNPYVERTPELQPDQFIPATQLYNQVDGNIYGITNAMDVDLLIYNLDILEESGFSTDPNTYDTWDAFYDAVLKLTTYEADGSVGRYGLQMDIQGSTTFSSWLTANGGSFYTPDLKRAGFNTPEGIETAEYLLRFYDANLLGGIGSFISWKAAMQRGINADPYFFEQAAPDIRYTMSAFPKGPSGTQRGATAWGNMYSIAKGSANPDLAFEFIKFYTSLEGNIEMFERLHYVSSPRRDFYQSEAWNRARMEKDWMPLIPQIAYVGGVYPFLKYSDFANHVWGPLMAPAFRRETSLIGAFEQAEQVYNRALAGESVGK